VGTSRPASALTFGRLAASLRGAPLLVSLALGLVLGDATAGDGAALPRVLLAVVAGAACLMLFAPDRMWRRLATALLAFALGHISADRVYRPNFPSDHVAVAPMHVPLHLEGVLAADPEQSGERLRFWLQAEQIDADQGWHAMHGQVLLTVRRAEHDWYIGDRLRVAVVLRRPRNFGNPGEFDGEGYWARRGVYVTGFADDDSGFERVGHVDAGLSAWLARWRRGVGALFRRTLPEPQAAVLSALIVGTDAALPRDVRTAFTRAGVSHVLSISGLHVGLVAAAGYALFRWLLARSQWLLLTTNVPKLAAALSALPVLLYAGIAGSNVATVRSVVMVLVFVAAVIVDRQRHLIVSLAFAALIIVLSAPGSARDISFQLSFFAVVGLVYGMERFWPWWKQWEEARLVRLRGWRARLWRPVAVYVVVSASALAATTPLTALHFNQISFAAPFANAVVVPLLGSAAVALGLLAAMAYALSEPLAQLFAGIAGPFVWLGLWLVEFFAGWPYAAIRVVTPTLLELAVLYAGLFTLVRLSGRARVVSLAGLALVALGDGASWYADRYHRSAMRITFLSVGQGDSAVVELPGSEVMVVDGGGLGTEAFDVGERVVAPFLWTRKIAHVDYLVLSHPQWDHYGGFGFLAAHFSPHEFWSNGTGAPSERFAQLQQTLIENGVERMSMHRGVRRRLGNIDALIYSPPQQLSESAVNDQSLVLGLAYGPTRVLFPGDIEAPAEADLVAASDGTLASAILKVPHHGSHTSSSAPFLDAVAPRLAVISAGFENRFGFPHPDVVARYAAHHAELTRTDLDGAVEVRVDAHGPAAVYRHRDQSPRWSWRSGWQSVAVDSLRTGR
jgi:competence protein ComEC